MPAGQRAAVLHERGERVANEAPLFVVGKAVEGNAECFGAEARDRNAEERCEDDRVFGLALHTDAVGAERSWTVATQDGPHDGDGEEEAGKVADKCVALVGASVEELECRRHLMVDLEHGGNAQQDDEAEVHHRVHDSGAGLAHERLHPHARAKIGEAGLDVLLGGRPVVGAATFPVLDSKRENPRPVNDHHRKKRVERQANCVGDVAEHRAVHWVVVRECEDFSCQAGERGEDGYSDANAEHKALWGNASFHGGQRSS